MKKFILGLLLLTTFIFTSSVDLQATSNSAVVVESVSFPRFAYNKYLNASDEWVYNNQLTIEFTTRNVNEVPAKTEYPVEIFQVYYGGQESHLIDSQRLSLVADGNYYTDTITFDLSKLRASEVFRYDEGIMFYHVKVFQSIVYSGAIMTHPDLENYSPTGDSELLVSKQTTNDTDFAQIVHYRLNPDVLNQGQHVYLRTFDLRTGLSVESYSSNEILNAQISDDTRQNLNAFFILDINGEMPEFLITEHELINELYSDNFLYDYPYGAYAWLFTGAGGVDQNISEVLWMHTANTEEPFEITLSTENPALTETLIVKFWKRDGLITDAFSTNIASDSSNSYFTASDIDTTTGTKTISYKPNEDVLSEGDTATITWQLIPDNITLIGGVPTDYPLDYSISYTVAEGEDLLTSVKSGINFFGLTDQEGGLLISFILLVLINLFLLLLKISGIANIFGSLFAVIISAILGLLPLWYLMGATFMIIIGFGMIINGSREGVSNHE